MSVGEAMGRTITGQAAAAVTTNRIVNMVGSLPEDLRFTHAGAAAVCSGVSLEGRASGDRDLPVQLDGFVYLECDATAAISVGSPIESNATGLGVIASGVGQHPLIGHAAQALASGTALIRVLINIQEITL